MIKLHFKVKVRVFGVTVGTVEDTRDVSGVLRLVFPQLGLPVASGVLYNERGVLIELVG
jgi:hypothetical protein